MRMRIGAALAAALFLFGARPCAASFLVSLSSSTPNLGALTIGQTVAVDVVLSGLNPGDTVDFLGATVNYDGTLLGPSTVTPGAIIPDVGGFSSSPPGTAGLANGQYDDLNLSPPPDFFPPISTNGILFSFTTQATAAGTGAFSFDPNSPAFIASDSNGDPLTGSAGSPLGFTVASPEPSAWLLAVFCGGGAFVFSWATRRRAEGSMV
jgi:hypothetical protein